jgi:hypothetical protein
LKGWGFWARNGGGFGKRGVGGEKKEGGVRDRGNCPSTTLLYYIIYYILVSN